MLLASLGLTASLLLGADPSAGPAAQPSAGPSAPGWASPQPSAGSSAPAWASPQPSAGPSAPPWASPQPSAGYPTQWSTARPSDEPSLEQAIEHREPVQFQLGARVELRSGQPEGGEAASNITDLEIDPVAEMRGPLRIGSVALGYEPRIFIIVRHPTEAPKRVSSLHRGHLVLDLRPTPLWRFFVDGRGSYGEFDFLPLSTVIPETGGTGLPPQQPSTPGSPPTAPTPTPGVGTLPSERFLLVVDVNASVGVVATLSPKLSWLVSGGYVYGGGANAEARALLPLSKGPRGITGGLWNVTRNDDLAFLLEVYDNRFSSGPHATIGNLTTTWSHVWSRTLATDLIGGIGGFHATVPASGANPTRTENKVLPVGGLGLRHAWLTRGAAWRNSLTFLAAPLPDQINGQVYERLGGVLRSTLAPGDHLLIEVSGGVSASIGAEQRDARLEGRIAYLFAPQFGVSIGARAAWLQGSPLLPTGFGWLGFVSIGTYAGTPLVGAQL